MSSSSIPTRMKAARLTKFNHKYEVQEIPVPKIGDNDLLLQTKAAGFCHTDHQVYQGVYKSKLPMTPSHEPVGIVVAVGQNASKQGWKIGQRVGMLNFRHVCGTCNGCKMFKVGETGKPDGRFCKSAELAGITHDGGFAEYVVADADTSALLPDSISFAQGAPLMCAGATVWGAIASAKLNHEKREPVAIIGIGGLGQLGVQFLKALGHPVAAIDNRRQGTELAMEAGPENLRADLVVNYHEAEAVEKLTKFGGGTGGVAAVIVCTEDPEVNAWSLKIVRPTGIVVTVGLPVEGFHYDAFDLVFKQITVRGSLICNKTQVDEMIRVVDKHGIRSHITAIPLDKASELTEMYMDKELKGRIVVTM